METILKLVDPKNFYTLAIFLMLAVWVLLALKIALKERTLSWRTGLNLLTAVCLISGAVGFFGSALSSTGSLNWLPNTFEWPVGRAQNVLVSVSGKHIVPHVPSGRVQIYDRDLKFQRGWPVNASGGDFLLTPAADNEFYVLTQRNDYKYRYDLYGKLLSTERVKHEDYETITDVGYVVYIPTAVYLLVFVNPFLSWLAAMIGIILRFIGEGLDRRTPPGTVSW
jgi:hypothetical protein